MIVFLTEEYVKEAREKVEARMVSNLISQSVNLNEHFVTVIKIGIVPFWKEIMKPYCNIGSM